MKNKTMLRQNPALGHIYVNKFYPIEERIIRQKLTKEIKSLTQTQDVQGRVNLHGNQVNLKEGSLRIRDLHIKYIPNQKTKDGCMELQLSGK